MPRHEYMLIQFRSPQQFPLLDRPRGSLWEINIDNQDQRDKANTIRSRKASFPILGGRCNSKDVEVLYDGANEYQLEQARRRAQR